MEIERIIAIWKLAECCRKLAAFASERCLVSRDLIAY